MNLTKKLQKVIEAPFDLVGWLIKNVYGRVVAVLLLAILALMTNYPVRDTIVGTLEVKDVLSEQYSREGGQSDVDATGRIDRNGIDNRTVVKRLDMVNPIAFCTLPFHNVSEREVKLLDESWDPTGKLKVKHRVVETVSRGLTLGLDLQGGTELRYRIISEGEGKTTADANAIAEIIRRRVDAYGLKEPRIQPLGTNRILIQIPGFDASDVSRIKAIISRIGRLEFRIVADPEHDAAALQEAERTGKAPEGWHWYTAEREDTAKKTESERLLISDEIQLTGDNIDSVDVGAGGRTGGEMAVHIRFKDREAFWTVTQKNVGRRLAIVLDDVRDSKGSLAKQGRVHSAPRINEPILGSAEITGGFTQKTAEDLKYVLQSGSLEAPLESESEQFVGPYQGKRSIEQGTNAAVIGFIAVLAFMAFYYLKDGLIANFGLLLNLMLLIAALALRGATLTLPGIAGIILTIGMAVDANVLIFERIREELGKLGDKPVLKCMRDGHSRALITIIDTHMTTVITAIILYQFGTGPVRGFAVTLAYGLIISLFTSVVATRIIFEALNKAGLLKSMKMLKLIPENPNIPFVKWRHVLMTGSVIVVIGSLVYFFYAPGNRVGVEFSAGTLVQVNMSEKVNAEEVRARLENVEFKNAEVQELGGAAGEKVGRVSSSFAIRLSYVPQVKITQAKRLTETGGTGVEIVVQTDRQANPEQMEKRMAAEGSLGVTVRAGEKQGSLYQYIIHTPEAAPEAVSAFEANVRTVFESELTTSDIRAAFETPKGSLLVPEGVKRISDDGTKMTVRIALSEPVTADKLSAALAGRTAGVEVKAMDVAADGRAGVFNLTMPSGTLGEIKDALRLAGFSTLEPIGSVTRIFPSVARELTTKAIIAVGLAMLAIIAYIWFRFEFRFGVGAVVALIHDVAITLGALALTGRQISLTVIAAILTIIGYSLNDTIVVFDRIRENMRGIKKMPLPDLINLSINQTLARTTLTSFLTLITVLALYMFGGPAINDFAFAMVVGIVVGTYSSVFIASPILLMMGEHAAPRGPIAAPIVTRKAQEEEEDGEEATAS